MILAWSGEGENRVFKPVEVERDSEFSGQWGGSGMGIRLSRGRQTWGTMWGAAKRSRHW